MLMSESPFLAIRILLQAAGYFNAPRMRIPRPDPRLCHGMKIRDIIAKLKEDGWYQVAQKGSHRQFKHPLKRGRVTIAGGRNDDLAPATLNSILEQAGPKGKS
jgi:predicted RNA binding protein YcfA (HicA-like mRNA interferase family)